MDVPSLVSKISALFENERPKIVEFLSRRRAFSSEAGGDLASDSLANWIENENLDGGLEAEKILHIKIGPRHVDRSRPALIIDCIREEGHSAYEISSSLDSEGVTRATVSAAIGVGVTGVLRALGEEDIPSASVMFVQGLDSSPDQPSRPISETLRGVNAIHSFSLTESLAPGTIGLKLGPVFPASYRFKIRLFSRTRAATYELEMHKQIQAGSHLVISLGRIASRKIDPLAPVKILVSSIATAHDQSRNRSVVEIGGSFRVPPRFGESEVSGLLKSTIEGIAASDGIEFEMDVRKTASAVIPDEGASLRLLEKAAELLGRDRVHRMQYASHNLDHLAEYYRAVSGNILHLGVGDRLSANNLEVQGEMAWALPTIEAGVKTLALALAMSGE